MTPQPTPERENTAAAADAVTQPYSLEPLPGSPASPGEPGPDEPEPTELVALIICHGMGQQVRHETLAEAADNLRSRHAKKALVRYVRFTNVVYPAKNDRLLPRAEIEVDVPDQPGQPGFRQLVHVYEVYWAPLTEGQISLTEVVRFLASSGGQGIRYSFSHFTRWLFGKEVQLPVDRYTFWKLFGLLALVLSLVLINTIMTLVVGENLLQTDATRHTPPELLNRLTTNLGWLLLTGLVLAGGIRVCTSLQRRPASRPWAVSWVWLLLFGTGALLLVTAGLMSWNYLTLHNLLPASNRTAVELLSWRTAWVGLVWATALAVSWWCRGFLVQYLGDVAIYVDAYKVDKYFTIRARIRQIAQRTMEAVYGARKESQPRQFRYRRVVVAGHSLGSLVAYDALNSMLVTDEAMGEGLQVATRTPALVTFGSPLDKTAFLFHAQARKTAVYTALDSSRQPLVWNKAARQAIQWVNLHATADIISGPLDYYDQPDTGQFRPQPVLNCPDPDAFTPVYAHTQYWNGRLLSRALRFALGGRRSTCEQLNEW